MWLKFWPINTDAVFLHSNGQHSVAILTCNLISLVFPFKELGLVTKASKAPLEIAAIFSKLFTLHFLKQQRKKKEEEEMVSMIKT